MLRRLLALASAVLLPATARAQVPPFLEVLGRYTVDGCSAEFINGSLPCVTGFATYGRSAAGFVAHFDLQFDYVNTPALATPLLYPPTSALGFSVAGTPEQCALSLAGFTYRAADGRCVTPSSRLVGVAGDAAVPPGAPVAFTTRPDLGAPTAGLDAATVQLESAVFVVDYRTSTPPTTFGSFAVPVTLTATPEPSTFALGAAGCALLGAWARRRRVAV
jgi:hypothetical protein